MTETTGRRTRRTVPPEPPTRPRLRVVPDQIDLWPGGAERAGDPDRKSEPDTKPADAILSKAGLKAKTQSKAKLAESAGSGRPMPLAAPAKRTMAASGSFRGQRPAPVEARGARGSAQAPKQELPPKSRLDVGGSTRGATPVPVSGPTAKTGRSQSGDHSPRLKWT